MACTDNEDKVDWLRRFDDNERNLDVTDDFESENRLLERANGVHGFASPLSRGDYICKILLGPVDDEVDKLNSSAAAAAAGGGAATDCGCAVA